MKADERVPAPPTRAETTTEPMSGRAAAEGRPEPVAHERCVRHPGKAAVARCSACEAAVCLTCAVPVRGRVLGPECLADELGDPRLTAPPNREPAGLGSWGAVVGAVVAVLATIGPWTRTGAGDRLLGAWVPSVRWSMVTAVAALVLLPAAWWFRTRGAPAAIVIAAGAAVVAGSALAIAFPPTFQAASWGPWLAGVGGAVAVAGAIVGDVVERRRGQGV